VLAGLMSGRRPRTVAVSACKKFNNNTETVDMFFVIEL
jgi:hypothetical protein